MTTAPLDITNLRKTFRSKRNSRRGKDVESVVAIDDANLEVGEHEFIVLLGPSGCGKTTLLRSVAGLEEPERGRIAVAGKVVFAADGSRRRSVPTADRGLSMMFQSYALWPHMTVNQNIAYPLEVRGVPSAERQRRVGEMLELLGLGATGQRYPAQISGGQQQRVALGRALIAESPLVLFDEPLSNVDARVRDQLRNEIAGMQRKLGFAGLYVTHDQREAFSLGHRVAVLRAGRIEQIAVPRELYDRPSSLYVARFVGSTNELPGTVVDIRSATVQVDTEIGQLIGRSAVADVRKGDQVTVVFRPENCTLTACDDSFPGDVGPNDWDGLVNRTVFEGATATHSVSLLGQQVIAMTVAGTLGDLTNRKVRLHVAEDALLVMKPEAA